MVIAIWIFAALLMAGWSLLAWLLHALAGLDAALLGRLDAWVDSLPSSAWLDAWWPGWSEAMHAAVDLLHEAVLRIGDVAPALVWLFWGTGIGLIALSALLLTLIVRLLARELGTPPTKAAGKA